VGGAYFLSISREKVSYFRSSAAYGPTQVPGIMIYPPTMFNNDEKKSKNQHPLMMNRQILLRKSNPLRLLILSHSPVRFGCPPDEVGILARASVYVS